MTVVRITEETWSRIQALATPFRGSELGTPEKVITMLLDAYEEEHPPPPTGRRDATPAEIANEHDGVLESMACGELNVTETTRQLARAELLDRARKAER